MCKRYDRLSEGFATVGDRKSWPYMHRTYVCVALNMYTSSSEQLAMDHISFGGKRSKLFEDCSRLVAMLCLGTCAQNIKVTMCFWHTVSGRQLCIQHISFRVHRCIFFGGSSRFVAMWIAGTCAKDIELTMLQ